MGLFKPAWMNIDEEKALKASYRVKEPAELARIIEQAPHASVRLSALNRLSDETVKAGLQPVLAEIVADRDNSAKLLAENKWAILQLRLEALREISDPAVIGGMQSVLIDIVADGNDKTRPRSKERPYVALTLDLGSDISQIVRDHDTSRDGDREYTYSCLLRREAVERITDQAALEDFARNHSDDDICKHAMRGIKNQAVLADIAWNFDDDLTRAFAVRCIEDEVVLADIAKNNTSSEARKTAACTMTGQAVIEDIALTASDPQVRAFAVEKLADRSVVRSISENDRDKAVRERARKILENETTYLCPKCGEVIVVEFKISPVHEVYKKLRKKECPSCGSRYTMDEMIKGD